jgi:hypothetical protein
MTDNSKEASMSEIKPVTYISNDADLPLKEGGKYWLECEPSDRRTPLYPAAALEALQAENEELRLMLSGSTLQIQAMQAQINAMKIAQKVLDGVVQAQSISDSEWREKYMREVEGLNNEGDPIGGDPPSGLRHAVEYFKSENAAQAKEIEALRKQVEILQRPLDDEIIARIIVLVKDVSDEELASNVFASVRNMTNWNKSTPAEFLVLFDKPSAQKGTE